MSVKILDHEGFTLVECASLVLALAAEMRGECIQTGPDTFQVRANTDHMVRPKISAQAKRNAYLANQRRKANL